MSHKDQHRPENSRGHVWELNDYENEDGSRGVDIFAYSEYPYCNGPRCTVCGYGYCHHCHDEPQEDCPGAQE